MPTFDKLALGKKAREFGFTRDAFEKMSRLTDILQYINAEQDLYPHLALKGGTAINLTMFNLPRLSVDIDLDFTGNMTRDETAVKRERVKELLGRYMVNENYSLKDKSKRTYALDSFVYAYDNAAGSPDNLKIEINYILRSHVLPTNESTARTGGAFSDFIVRTLSPVEVFASKIVALSDRAAARDLYDLNNMICLGLFDESELTLLRKCAVFYMAVAGNVNSQGVSFARMKEITPYKVRTDLNPMIRNAERFDLLAAREQVTNFLNEWMALTEKESVFLKQFAIGNYRPQLLFEDDEIVKRIESHPMAIWRLRHIRDERSER